jgi:hypothetical protein
MRVVTGLSLIAMALRFIAVPAYAQTQEELAEQARKHCNPVVPSSQVEGAFDLMLLLLVQVPPDDGVQSCMWQLSRITGPAGIVALHIQYSAETFNSSSEAQKEFEETRKANRKPWRCWTLPMPSISRPEGRITVPSRSSSTLCAAKSSFQYQRQ